MKDISSANDETNRAMRSTGVNTPIFLTGCSRSGTTWLNSVFRDYLDGGFVNEGQFIISFGRRLSRYGDLSLNHNRLRLVDDLRHDSFFRSSSGIIRWRSIGNEYWRRNQLLRRWFWTS